ncbi:MAG: hypothetical protein AAF846_26555 [Chloroflexota bacterium]
MSWNVKWFVPKCAYIIQMNGKLTQTDFIAGCEAVRQFVLEGIGPVHCIIDARDTTMPHITVSEVSNTAQVFNEPNLGSVLLISNKPIIRMLGSILCQRANKRCRFANSIDEALTILHYDDPKLLRITDPPIGHTH